MEPKVVERDGFNVVGLLYRGKNENQEIPQLWGRFGQIAEGIKHKQNLGVSYGAMGNYDKDSGEFDYLASIEVERLEDLSPDMVGWEIPAQTYAIFPCTLPKIRVSYDFALHKWLPESGYEHTGGIEFEMYGEEFNPQDPDSVFYYYMPIKEK